MTDRQFTVVAIALGGAVIFGVGYVLIKNASKEADNKTGDWITGIAGAVGGIATLIGGMIKTNDSKSGTYGTEWSDKYGGTKLTD